MAGRTIRTRVVTPWIAAPGFQGMAVAYALRTDLTTDASRKMPTTFQAVVFLAFFGATLWTWWGIPRAIVAIVAIALGAAWAFLLTLNHSTVGVILGGGPDGSWYANRIAAACGLAAGGLVSLLLFVLRRVARRKAR